MILVCEQKNMFINILMTFVLFTLIVNIKNAFMYLVQNK